MTGAWSADSFGNDDALDWVADFQEVGVDAVTGALGAAGASYLQADDGSRIIAAAEAVAAAFRSPSATIPAEMSVALKSHGDAIRAHPEIREAARTAVRAVLEESSELRELWEDAGTSAKWREAVRDLERRLVQ